MDTKRALGAVGVAGLLLLTGGCGKAAEKATEKAVEKQTGGQVDIDGDKVKVSTPDGGSCSYDGSGKMVCTDKDGKSSSVDYSPSGSGTELPDGWPSALDPPKGAKIITSATNSVNGRDNMTVLASVPGDPKDVTAALREQLTDAGYEISGDNSGSSGGTSYGALTASNGKNDVVVSVGQSTTAEGSAVTMSVTPTT